MTARYTKIWGRLTESMLFLPTMALILILIADFFLIHNFFAIEVKDGHLYGNVIDILVHGSPTMILAIGMTLVIATGGVDLSVGAVMALSGTLMAGSIIAGVPPYAAILIAGGCYLVLCRSKIAAERAAV